MSPMRFLKHWLVTLGVAALFYVVPVGLVFLIIWHDFAGFAALMLLIATLLAVWSYEKVEPRGW